MQDIQCKETQVKKWKKYDEKAKKQSNFGLPMRCDKSCIRKNR